MKRTYQNTIQTTLCLLLTVALVLGLAPAIAHADTTVGVKVEAPVRVNETVALVTEDTKTDVVSEEAPKPSLGEQINSEVAVAPETAPKPSQITTDVTLVTTSDTQTETLLVDGLIYLVDHTSQSATLTGWYSKAPTGDLSIPSEITDGKNTFKVQFAGGGTF
ncbi:MAG: hypothetical protein RR547_12380 [Raoultibacter sp.]